MDREEVLAKCDHLLVARELHENGNRRTLGFGHHRVRKFGDRGHVASACAGPNGWLHGVQHIKDPGNDVVLTSEAHRKNKCEFPKARPPGGGHSSRSGVGWGPKRRSTCA